METDSQVTTKQLESKRLVLEELRRLLDKSWDASDTLDSKFQSLLNSASLIVTLVSTVQIALLRQRTGNTALYLLALVFLLYGAVFVLTYLALRPRKFKAGPISFDWEEVKRVYFERDEEAALTQVISDYLYAYATNDKVSHEKAQWFRIALLLFVLIVVILLVMVFIGVAN